MRSGFSMLSDPQDGKIAPDSPLGRKLLSLVFVLIKRAAQSAAVYCEHSGRSLVTPDDVKLALKYHTHRFFKDEGLEEEAEEMHLMLENDMNSGEEDGVDMVLNTLDDDEDEEEEESCEEEEEERHNGQACGCDLCQGMVSFDWDAWLPDDPAEIFMKQCVEKTMASA